MGNAEHLAGLAKRLQLAPDRLGRPSPDSRVNLVKHHRGQPLPRLSPGRRPARHHNFQRQHHPRQFAARGNVFDRPRRLASIGGNQVLDPVQSIRRPVLFLVRTADLDLELRLHRQLGQLGLGLMVQCPGRLMRNP